MAKLIALSIDVSKIDKSKLYKGKKGNYLKLTVSLNDEKDEYGNDVAAWQEQTPEERQAREYKNYLGNGKVFWSSNQSATQSAPQPDNGNDDDLPF